MIIKDEAAADRTAIHALVQSAFGHADEAKLVDALRADGELVVSLVAIEDDRIVGHIALSPLQSPRRALALAPLAVAAGHRRQGIGAALIDAALARARTLPADMIFVLGDPAYYGRFGFTTSAADPYDSMFTGPHFMALALTATQPKSAPVIYARAFGALG